MIFKLLLLPLFFFSGSLMAAKPEIGQDYKTLDKKLSQQADLIRKLKTENQLLRSAQVSPPAKVEKPGLDSELALYQAFEKSFKAEDQANYRKALRLLAKNYPNSKYFANVYFTAGRSALAKKNYKVALKSFNKVIRRFPKSKTAQLAEYSKAYTYQQMNLNQPAANIYKDLVKRYPNTSLANRSNIQLKRMLQTAKTETEKKSR